MSDLVRHGAQLDPMTTAQIFRASGIFPDIQSEAAAATKIIIGRGLGIGDFDAMSGLHIIKGKAVLSSNLMAAAIKRSGKYDYRVVVSDDTVCTIDFFGGGEKIGSSSFSVEDAKRAGLSGDNWRKYTRAMLFARCISAGYKTHCPDALGAAPVYVEAHGETEITEDAPPPPPRKALPAAPTREDRRADTERLLSPVPTPPAAPVEIPIDGGSDAPTPKAPSTVLLTAAKTRIAKVTTPKGAVHRVDVEGDERPYAVIDATLAESIEANLAFKVAMEAAYTTNSAGKRVIDRIAEVGHG
jgi:hypothetical protein